MNRQEIEQHWTKEAEKSLKGRKVKSLRYLSAKEAAGLGWHQRPLVIEFDDGTLVFASRDDEGNGAGALFGQGPNNEELVFPVLFT